MPTFNNLNDAQRTKLYTKNGWTIFLRLPTSISPTIRLIAKNYPRKRMIELRPNKKLNVDKKNGHKLTASLMYERGRVMERRCLHCSSTKGGMFKECVVLEGVSKNACANCQYIDHAYRCSHYLKPHLLPDEAEQVEESQQVNEVELGEEEPQQLREVELEEEKDLSVLKPEDPEPIHLADIQPLNELYPADDFWETTSAEIRTKLEGMDPLQIYMRQIEVQNLFNEVLKGKLLSNDGLFH